MKNKRPLWRTFKNFIKEYKKKMWISGEVNYAYEWDDLTFKG